MSLLLMYDRLGMEISIKHGSKKVLIKAISLIGCLLP